MAVTEDKVLKILNMEGTAFEEGAVELHIEMASALVDAKNRSGASADIVEVAKLRLAAYYAYLAYCDMPENHLPGQTDDEGDWDPVADPPARLDMKAKLDALKKASDEAIEAMQESLASVTSIAPAFGGMRIK